MHIYFNMYLSRSSKICVINVGKQRIIVLKRELEWKKLIDDNHKVTDDCTLFIKPNAVGSYI